MIPGIFGRPTMDGKTARGASSPAKPALHMPLPLSTTNAATSFKREKADPERERNENRVNQTSQFYHPRCQWLAWKPIGAKNVYAQIRPIAVCAQRNPQTTSNNEHNASFTDKVPWYVAGKPANDMELAQDVILLLIECL